MRYEKGTMELSPARDIPLLQQVLRSGFVTGNQLYEFMRLEQTEGSRQAFDHRVRRLVGHGLIEKRPGLARGRHQVYSISKDGASVLIDAGELFAGRRNVDVVKQSCAHWLELNEVHLALWRSRALVRWTPATEICSQNLTSYRYVTAVRRALRSSTNERLRRLGLTARLPTRWRTKRLLIRSCTSRRTIT